MNLHDDIYLILHKAKCFGCYYNSPTKSDHDCSEDYPTNDSRYMRRLIKEILTLVRFKVSRYKYVFLNDIADEIKTILIKQQFFFQDLDATSEKIARYLVPKVVRNLIFYKTDLEVNYNNITISSDESSDDD